MSKLFDESQFKALFTRFVGEPKATDVLCAVGVSPRMRIDGVWTEVDLPATTEEQMKAFFESLPGAHQESFSRRFSADLSMEAMEQRFRLNVFKQRGTIAVCIRRIPQETPSLKHRFKTDSDAIAELLKKQRGFIVFSGPSGSGKTTSLAVCVNHINEHLNFNVISIEDPIEFLHKAIPPSLVLQREIGDDVMSFKDGLQHALRQSPNVIVVGEMRADGSFDTALRAAETGHLILTTLHARNVQETVTRIVGELSKDKEQEYRGRVADAITAIISQRLVVCNGDRELVYEMLIADKAVRQLIRSSQEHQLATEMKKQKQLTLDEKMEILFKQGRIDRNEYDSQSNVD